jgi:polar amino acid transport system substrate-binding protein
MVKDESADDLMMIRKLGEGRTAFAVGEEGNLKFISMQIGIQLETAYLLLEDPNYFAFSKASGDDGKMLAEKFDQTIRQLRKEGVVDKIIAKYLGTDE